MVYGNTGKADLLNYAKKLADHQSKKKSYLATTLLWLNWRKPSDEPSEFSTCTPMTSEFTMLLYGVVENVHATASCPALKDKKS